MTSSSRATAGPSISLESESPAKVDEQPEEQVAAETKDDDEDISLREGMAEF